ncbi:MAG: hypothetical protein L6Q78_12265 [Bacteroidia bacterium]|nr:hypothetical protein [Bacteroidia bacterium]
MKEHCVSLLLKGAANVGRLLAIASLFAKYFNNYLFIRQKKCKNHLNSPESITQKCKATPKNIPFAQANY